VLAVGATAAFEQVVQAHGVLVPLGHAHGRPFFTTFGAHQNTALNAQLSSLLGRGSGNFFRFRSLNTASLYAGAPGGSGNTRAISGCTGRSQKMVLQPDSTRL